MATREKLASVALRGPPQRLTAVVNLGAPTSKTLPVTVELPGGAAVLRASVTPFGQDSSEIRLELPRDTPPGTYGAVAKVGGRNRKVQFVVEPVERLRIHPRQTTFTAGPGGREAFSVTVVNTGNVPLTIRRTAEVDLEDDEAQDRALGKSLRAELGENETRMDRFFEEIREGHGGAARLTVARGAGEVEPGQSCELSGFFEVPVTVKPGRTYSGGWDIGDSAHLIVLNAVNGDPKRPRRGRRKT